MLKCQRCKVEKDEAFFAEAAAYPMCRWCYLHKKRGPALRRLALENAGDAALLGEVQARLAYIERAIQKRACQRCKEPAAAFFTHQGEECQLRHYAELLFSNLHIGGILAKRVALCGPCSLGAWAATPAPTDPAQALGLAQGMSRKWRAKALKAPPQERGVLWRAVYYWDKKVKLARQAVERAEAAALDAMPTPVEPWFGSLDEE